MPFGNIEKLLHHQLPLYKELLAELAKICCVITHKCVDVRSVFIQSYNTIQWSLISMPFSLLDIRIFIPIFHNNTLSRPLCS